MLPPAAPSELRLRPHLACHRGWQSPTWKMLLRPAWLLPAWQAPTCCRTLQLLRQAGPAMALPPASGLQRLCDRSSHPPGWSCPCPLPRLLQLPAFWPLRCCSAPSVLEQPRSSCQAGDAPWALPFRWRLLCLLRPLGLLACPLAWPRHCGRCLPCLLRLACHPTCPRLWILLRCLLRRLPRSSSVLFPPVRAVSAAAPRPPAAVAGAGRRRRRTGTSLRSGTDAGCRNDIIFLCRQELGLLASSTQSPQPERCTQA